MFIGGLITNHPHLFESNPVPTARNRSVKRPLAKNLWGTPWGRMIRDPEVRDPSSRLGRLFRLRFRMPFDLFEEGLLPLVRRAGFFSNKGRIPLEIKVMVALRRLGRGLVLDDVGELADLSTSTVDWIFHIFGDVILINSSACIPGIGGKKPCRSIRC